MTTLSDVIERTKRHLYSGETRDERNRLTDAIAANATSLAVDFDVRGIQQGTLLAIELEELYVWEVTGKTVTVERAQGGSTADVYTAGTIITVNPKFSDFAILKAVNEELADLSSPENGLFAVDDVQVTYQPGTDAYNLTGVTDLLRVLDVTYDANDGTGAWLRLPEWTLKRNLPTSEFASGMALHVQSYAEPAASINISYAKGFTALTALSQSIESTAGVPATAVDIVSLGAAMRLLAGTEVSRNFLDQGDTRRADEVPPQARASSYRGLAALRRERISAERARLLALYPFSRR